MRPDIDPMSGELGILALVAVVAWLVWAWMQTRSEP